MTVQDDVVVIRGALDGRRLALRALGLGDGGIPPAAGADRSGRIEQPAARAAGRAAGRAARADRAVFDRTIGGVLVEARPEGVKLDFPSSHELLLTPDGRVHLRSGEVSPRFPHALKLQLTDGTVLRLRRSAGGERPLQLVEIVDRERSRVVWRDGRRASQASLRRRFHSPSWVVLGDGRVVYRAMPLGLLVVLERLVCPDELAARFPERRAVVAGDVLLASLQLLPRTVPRHLTGFPQAREVSETLAALAPRLLPPGLHRPPARTVGAAGRTTVPLPGRFRVRVTVRGGGPVAVELYGAGRDTPHVEWTVTETTRLHLVHPDGGRDGRPRYVLQGLVLRELVEPLMPFRATPQDKSRARWILAELGEPRRHTGPARPVVLPSPASADVGGSPGRR